MKPLSHLRKKLKSAFSMESDYRKLKCAIEEGRLAPYCGIQRYFGEVCQILGGDDELAAATLIMVLEEAEESGVHISNVRELLRYMALQAGIPEE